LNFNPFIIITLNQQPTTTNNQPTTTSQMSSLLPKPKPVYAQERTTTEEQPPTSTLEPQSSPLPLTPAEEEEEPIKTTPTKHFKRIRPLQLNQQSPQPKKLKSKPTHTPLEDDDQELPDIDHSFLNPAIPASPKIICQINQPDEEDQIDQLESDHSEEPIQVRPIKSKNKKLKVS
jgi:hypothetical protein